LPILDDKSRLLLEFSTKVGDEMASFHGFYTKQPITANQPVSQLADKLTG
jgi:hypothetical protein